MSELMKNALTIKELLSKSITLDYKEMKRENKVIMRWGNDIDYIECKIESQDHKPISRSEVAKTKSAMEDLIEAVIVTLNIKTQECPPEFEESFRKNRHELFARS
jgi:hypothetical protein